MTLRNISPGPNFTTIFIILLRYSFQNNNYRILLACDHEWTQYQGGHQPLLQNMKKVYRHSEMTNSQEITNYPQICCNHNKICQKFNLIMMLIQKFVKELYYLKYDKIFTEYLLEFITSVQLFHKQWGKRPLPNPKLLTMRECHLKQWDWTHKTLGQIEWPTVKSWV